VIPVDWEAPDLEDMTRLIIDGTHYTPRYTDYGIPFLRVTDLQSSNIDLERLKFISPEEHQVLKQRCNPESGDLLLSKNGTIGLTKVVDWEWEFSIFVSLALIKVKKEKLDVYYLDQFFKSNFIYDQLKKRSKQGTVTNLHLEEIRELIVPVPPSFKEQKAIAQTLSDVDALIAALDKLIVKKRHIKTGTMQQLLTGKTRLPGFSGEWEVKKLGDVVDFSNGKAHENSILQNGKFIVINSKFISTQGEVKKYSDSCFCSVSTDQIVMVMSDVPNGKAIAKCFYIDKEDKYTLNQRICSLKAITVDSKILFYLIDRNPYYLAFDDGVKQTNLRKEDVLSCPLKLPPTLEEQKAIAQVLSDIDSEITALEKRRAKTQAIKQGMMQELLTGKTRLINN
jgi:type I restriction enzyme S subunit